MGEVSDFPHPILWFSSWFFYSSLSNANERISTRGKNKTKTQPPLQTYSSLPYILIHTHTFYNPSLTHRYPSLHSHTHTPYAIILLYMSTEKRASTSHTLMSFAWAGIPDTGHTPQSNQHPTQTPPGPLDPTAGAHTDTHTIYCSPNTHTGSRRDPGTQTAALPRRSTQGDHRHPHALHCAPAPERTLQPRTAPLPVRLRRTVP